MGIEMAWMMTSTSNQCNTVRRAAGTKCMYDWWSKSNSDRYTYYYLKATNYAQIQNVQDCVGQVFLPAYLAAKKASDSDSSAGLLTISALILGYLA